MRIRTVSVALGLSAFLVVTLFAVSVGQHTASGIGSNTIFGDGSDGPMTFSTNTKFIPPADAVVEFGSSGGTTLLLSSISDVFQTGQTISVHQSRGTNAA